MKRPHLKRSTIHIFKIWLKGIDIEETEKKGCCFLQLMKHVSNSYHEDEMFSIQMITDLQQTESESAPLNRNYQVQVGVTNSFSNRRSLIQLYSIHFFWCLDSFQGLVWSLNLPKALIFFQPQRRKRSYSRRW